MSKFNVRLLTPTATSLKNYISNTYALRKGSSRPGIEDVDYFLACDPKGVLVGELDGKPMSFVCFLKYTDTFCAASSFFVEPQHRGKGYGRKLLKTAIKTLLPSHIVTAYVRPMNIHVLTSKYCAKEYWRTPIVDFDLRAAYQVLDQLPPNLFCRAKPVDKVDFQALVNYDTSVFGYTREAFVHKVLNTRGGHARVAVNNDGGIVGFAAARVALLHEEGYQLGPLYADSIDVATVLLRSLFREMLERGWSSSSSVLMASPVGRNSEAQTLMDLLAYKVAIETKYLAARGLPHGCFDKWFAITSTTIG